MGTHINDEGLFQSGKYPTCPAGKVPLSVKDPSAQDLLWTYAQRRRAIDAEFADDLEAALRSAGYAPPGSTIAAWVLATDRWCPLCGSRDVEVRVQTHLGHADDEYHCIKCNHRWWVDGIDS